MSQFPNRCGRVLLGKGGGYWSAQAPSAILCNPVLCGARRQAKALFSLDQTVCGVARPTHFSQLW